MPHGTDTLKLVVLDCDGTIVDSQKAIVTVMHEAFGAHGVDKPSRHDIRRIVGLDLEEAISILVNSNDYELVNAITESYRHAAKAQRDTGDWEDPLYENAKKVIRAFDDAGWLLGVATGKARVGLDHVLAQHDLMTHFSTLQTSDVAPGKPHPEMLYRAMRDTGVGAENVYMVGDTTFDMDMAANAGTHGIGVSWGYHGTEELREAGARVVVDSFQELFNLLDQSTVKV